MGRNTKSKRKTSYKQVEFQPKERKLKRKVKLEEPNKLEQQPIVEDVQQPQIQVEEVVTKRRPVTEIGNDYVEYEEKLYKRQALQEIRPDLFKVKADDAYQSKSNFGTAFPKWASKGDIFVRVDMLPNKVFKFDGTRWIEVNKTNTTSYMDEKYLEHLITKINSGEMDVTHLTAQEEEQIRAYLSTQKR